ncbi:diguanylate cyclase [Streptomyces sp. NPDC026206]|uniref:GGDEF domain-containing protein n=1 Tax=Streptomyces sp. NPDC026206 TaxID=3157089 RepID=UPI0033F854D6
MAAAYTPLESVEAAAEGARRALGGSFAAVSVWEREHGRLRVLVNVGERAAGEERFPGDESYPVHAFPEIAEFLHEVGAPPSGSWGRAGGQPHAWVETAEGTVDSGGAGGTGGTRDFGRTGDAGNARGARGTRGAGGTGDAGDAAGAVGGAGAYRHQRVAALRRRQRGCCVVAPIMLHGRAWGELYVARSVGAPVFGRGDAEFATVLAAVTASGIAQTERLEEVRRLAFTDPLTGLANRRAVDARLDEALERHQLDGVVVSLVVCDLNGLKRVNDTLGHAVGDRLLERFASVLSLCGAKLPGALAARLGGDEFCLLTVGPTADEVVRIADELCRRAGELELGEGVACGVASTGDPIGPVRSARRLFRLADAAQYRAKGARSAEPVVAGRDGGREDPVVRLADRPPAPAGAAERRRFRGRGRDRGGTGPSGA